MKSKTILAIFGTLLLFAFVFSIGSCKKEEDDIDDNNGKPALNEYTLYDNVVIIDSTITSKPVIEENTCILEFTSEPPNIQVGDILVIQEDGGHLIKVVSIQKSSSETNFLYTFIFIKAYITEVFRNCNFIDTINIITTNKDFGNTTLFNDNLGDVNLNVKIQEGFIQSGLKARFELVRINGVTETFSLSAIGGIYFKTDALFEADGTVLSNNPGENEKELLPPISFPFSIAGIPAQIYMGFYASFSADISAAASLNYSCYADGKLEIGATYTINNGWQPIWQKSSTYINEGLDWEMNIDARAMVYVKPEIKLLICGVAGPVINTKPFLSLDAEVNYPEWMWELNGGYSANLGFEVNVLGFFEIVDFETTLSQWETTIAQDSGNMGGGACDGQTSLTYGGQTYDIVEIGDQCWMAENLNIGTRINGSEDMSDNLVIEKYCYDNIESNCDTYGGLYQWSEMMQYITTEGAQGICPDGWHLPSDEEWTTLSDFLGGTNVAGGKMKEAGTAHWNSPNTGATNSSGFTVLPGGRRLHTNNLYWFWGLLGHAYFWSSTEISPTNAWIRHLNWEIESINRYDNFQKTNGSSIRCLKD